METSMQHVDLIAEYLLQLQRELAGVDAAVAHDALVDAEMLVDDSKRWCLWPTPEIVRHADRATVIDLTDLPPLGGK